MEIVDLKMKTRNPKNKRVAQAVRRQGGIPGILYGHGMEPLPIEVNRREFLHILHAKAGGNAVIQLKAEGVSLKESTCRIKELQHHPVSEEIMHVDFTVISMTETITVEVAIELKNADDSIGVKEGGVLDLLHHEIEVECLPTAIPEKIEIDVKEMAISDVIHFKDVQLPEGVSCELDPEDVIVALHPPRVEEAPAEGEEEEAAAEPEVIEKGKKEEPEEEK